MAFKPSGVAAVLFDLDGTLVDSAPDLAGAANEMRQIRGLAPLSLATLRPLVGAGARGMLGAALNVAPEHDEYEALKQEFLDRYEQRLTRETAMFDHVQSMLHALDQTGLPWGVVTNKVERFAIPLVTALGLHTHACVIIGGDTTPHAKPHPAPLLEAARRADVTPACCIYVGDDERDIVAGRAAGMQTAAAAWGYLGNGASIADWRADIVLSSPLELLQVLGLA
ncbi:phosphoglycolate phosphatase [Roseateles koreensis]|uniref:phosphoglycolate phosphatase n=1 Tax=Roseateles koreensis TaxID=2987526 RepID=A0ABT5KVH4_9BURK|nr:phosphoglycolate phosphatase [Roseateles koreensis]MDC8786939.1 phosphoglycolate phosphatase [Roseateles koreensis]